MLEVSSTKRTRMELATNRLLSLGGPIFSFAIIALGIETLVCARYESNALGPGDLGPNPSLRVWLLVQRSLAHVATQDLHRASSVYLPRRCSTSSRPLAACVGARHVPGLSESPRHEVYRHDDQRWRQPCSTASHMPAGLIKGRALPFYGFRNVHMAALSRSATGSDSATASSGTDSTRPSAMVRRCFSLCCASSAYCISQAIRMRPETSLDYLRTQDMPTKHI
jgi:hypothetical protein